MMMMMVYNANFERDQKNFFKKVEGGTKHVGQIPQMEKFVKFGETYEKKMICHKSETPWMESVSEQLREKITNLKELNITEEILEKETKKRTTEKSYRSITCLNTSYKLLTG